MLYSLGSIRMLSERTGGPLIGAEEGGTCTINR